MFIFTNCKLSNALHKSNYINLHRRGETWHPWKPPPLRVNKELGGYCILLPIAMLSNALQKSNYNNLHGRGETWHPWKPPPPRVNRELFRWILYIYHYQCYETPYKNLHTWKPPNPCSPQDKIGLLCYIYANFIRTGVCCMLKNFTFWQKAFFALQDES